MWILNLRDALDTRDNALNFVRLVLAGLVIVAHTWLVGGFAGTTFVNSLGRGPLVGSSLGSGRQRDHHEVDEPGQREDRQREPGAETWAPQSATARRRAHLIKAIGSESDVDGFYPCRVCTAGGSDAPPCRGGYRQNAIVGPDVTPESSMANRRADTNKGQHRRAHAEWALHGGLRHMMREVRRRSIHRTVPKGSPAGHRFRKVAY